MSRIFESLRRAELDVAERRSSETSSTKTIEKLDRRRTGRARVQIRLLVYGYTPKGTPFYEEARTIEINAHGALIAMKTAVPPGDRLLLTNESNHRTHECVVRAASTRHEGDVELAIVFAVQAPRFWRKLRPK